MGYNDVQAAIGLCASYLQFAVSRAALERGHESNLENRKTTKLKNVKSKFRSDLRDNWVAADHKFAIERDDVETNREIFSSSRRLPLLTTGSLPDIGITTGATLAGRFGSSIYWQMVQNHRENLVKSD